MAGLEAVGFHADAQEDDLGAERRAGDDRLQDAGVADAFEDHRPLLAAGREDGAQRVGRGGWHTQRLPPIVRALLGWIDHDVGPKLFGQRPSAG